MAGKFIHETRECIGGVDTGNDKSIVETQRDTKRALAVGDDAGECIRRQRIRGENQSHEQTMLCFGREQKRQRVSAKALSVFEASKFHEPGREVVASNVADQPW